MNAAKITRWTAPCSTVVRPVPRVSRDVEGQNEKRHVGCRNAQCDLTVEDDRDDYDHRYCQADAGDGRSEREIDAVLQPIAKG
jgi:hypothetical protein